MANNSGPAAMTKSTPSLCAFCGFEEGPYKACLGQKNVRGSLVWLHSRCEYGYRFLIDQGLTPPAGEQWPIPHDPDSMP
jgi:hypothetical protein